ncbi:MAG: hydroxymethylbilane synthase [Lysobacterales bacterium CG02_land_8_20_14_3_00_62_12]|nr:MAG: hydroxymethylbilane synthase [Xanthomonadales bacterium CG02_land_8_20_14_3_00_62_12]PJA41549.1 MAG: hydroxymethylbilane synthase [Xanthomonadales bacterium CG_4_9_14_3_um_filter_62_6]
MKLRIATRQSPLALWQTEHVRRRLCQHHRGLEIELVPLSTRGDEVLDRSLAAIGGKGLFLKELEAAMLDGRADLAVHSMKDVPMEVDADFAIGAILQRADPFDALVSNRHASFDALPVNARVGTSSLRRQAQLRARRPDLQLVDLRGNVNTRLRKLDADEYAAIVLACAGLDRLDMHARIRQRLTAPDFLPAVAQGAIGIEVLAGNGALIDLLSCLHDADTAVCVNTERAMNRHLHGSCQVPIAAYCTLDDGDLALTGLVGRASDGRCVRAHGFAAMDAFESLGKRVAEALLAQGAEELLRGA